MPLLSIFCGFVLRDFAGFIVLGRFCITRDFPYFIGDFFIFVARGVLQTGWCIAAVIHFLGFLYDKWGYLMADVIQTVIVSVRLPVDLVDRVDGVCGVRARSAFFRDALEAALVGRVAAEFVRRPSAVSSVGSSDTAVLFAEVRKKPMTVREASVFLSWGVRRVEKAAAGLEREGRIGYPRGAGVMVAL